jgi:hypothetical protein
MTRIQQDTMAMIGMTTPTDVFNPEVMAPGNSGAKLQMALSPNQIIQDNCVKNSAEGLKDALWLVWRTLVQYGDDYGVRKLAQEFHPDKKAEFLDALAFDDMNFNERKTIHVDLALGMRSEENSLQRQSIIQQTQQKLYETVTAMVASNTLTPAMYKKIKKPFSDTLYVLGIKEADAYLPTDDEVLEMITQSQEAMKNKQPSPEEEALKARAAVDTARAGQITAETEGTTANAVLDRVKAEQIQAEVAGNTASAQLEGYALIKEGKARSYGT